MPLLMCYLQKKGYLVESKSKLPYKSNNKKGAELYTVGSFVPSIA